ncbi:hypothetical protein AWC38_SpisGene24242 [Stylophora pistillata]|uniref:Uncharacterized protein n=1 Tax=Stylophora pistillata TaxID=50429 RepID=A0A2B4R680_STYPI|nr:hypothetical protein AWC38_SpisGene24242 [Stylophora pistillata]
MAEVVLGVFSPICSVADVDVVASTKSWTEKHILVNGILNVWVLHPSEEAREPEEAGEAEEVEGIEEEEDPDWIEGELVEEKLTFQERLFTAVSYEV